MALIAARFWDAHGGVYEHPDRLGYDAVWLGDLPMFRRNVPSKRREPHTQRHCVIIQNTWWLFIVRIVKNTWICCVSKIHSFLILKQVVICSYHRALKASSPHFRPGPCSCSVDTDANPCIPCLCWRWLSQGSRLLLSVQVTGNSTWFRKQL